MVVAVVCHSMRSDLHADAVNPSHTGAGNVAAITVAGCIHGSAGCLSLFAVVQIRMNVQMTERVHVVIAVVWLGCVCRVFAFVGPL
jgi:hypothetical protein